MISSKKLKSAIISSATAIAAFVSPIAAVTPSLSANAADGDNYAKLLQYSLYFYDANMCGNNSDCALSWRGNCHTNDEVPGGFHDAGDHVMFGQPQGYTAATLGWAYYEFKDAFDATGQTAHLKVITDKFAKFFRDATVLNGNTVSKVLIEKGEGGVDHSYWGAPENQGDRGRMLWSTGGAANVTAEYAAALAANYVNFGNTEDLKYAKALYDFSKKNPATYSCEFYSSGESGSKDELAWAAAWLYLATKDNQYLNDLNDCPEAWWVMNWENVAPGAAILKAEITGNWSGVHDLGSGDGYKFYDKWGSARHNATAQMCSLIASKYNKADSAWAKGQMQYLTGDKAFANGQSYCLVVGFKSNSSKNPHHRASSPDADASERNDSVQNKNLLVGALCGGPTDANGTYRDIRSDYVGNEVACDYNAGFVGAAAGLYHFYKTGSTESTIPGVTKVYGGGSGNNSQQQNNDWNQQNNDQNQNNDWNNQNNDQNQQNNWNDQNNNQNQQNNNWNNWNDQNQNNTWDWNNQNNNTWNGVVNNEWNNNNWDWNNQNQNQNNWNDQNNNQNQNNNDWNNQNNNQNQQNNDWNNQNQNNTWDWNNQNNNTWNGVVNNDWNNNNWDWNNQNQNNNWNDQN
ncbi:glycoside hydrolase family 9 protein, partial [Ruminococcus flavefaciens]